jgi:very-short-patch-repair endonuclease
VARPKGIAAWNKKEQAKITCKVCGKEFQVKAYRKDKARYCSRACNGKAALTGVFEGANSPRYNSVEHICRRCGKIFTVKRAHHDQGKYEYCSNACRYPEHVEITCKWCNKSILVTPAQKARGRKQFCSQPCHGAYTVATMQRQATSIETAVEQVLRDMKEPYTVQKQMGPYILDFYLSQYRLVIECDGTYWHSLPNVIEKDQKKDHWLAAHNFKILRLSEKSIRADVSKAVSEGMHSLIHTSL